MLWYIVSIARQSPVKYAQSYHADGLWLSPNLLSILITPTCVMGGFWRFHSTCRAHHSIFSRKQTVKGYFVNNKKVSAATSDSFLPKCKESKLKVQAFQSVIDISLRQQKVIRCRYNWC